MIRACALVCCLAGPVLAQDVPFDTSLITDCLEQTQGAQTSCVGLATERCLDQLGGGTTYDMVRCTGLEIDFWQQRLDENYQTGLDTSRAFDDELAARDDSPVNQMQTLIAMRLGFETYRSNRCQYSANVYAHGSIMGPVAAGCYLDLTGEFALFLETVWDE